MALSIRYKILGTYLLVFLLMGAIVWSSYDKMQGIDRRLRAVEDGYIPMLSLANGITHLYHLHEDFDASKLRQNRADHQFMETLRVAYPRLINNSLEQIESLVRSPLLSGALSPSSRRDFPDPILVAILVATQQIKRDQQLYQQGIENVLAADDAAVDVYAPTLRQQRDRMRESVRGLVIRLNAAVQREITKIGALERQGTWFTVVLSLLGGLAVLLLAVLALYILQPIRRLTESVKRISQGDYAHRVSLRARDEVGLLANEFNKMAASIEHSIHDEKLVAVGQLSAQITHEIRNPLNSIGLNLALLREDLTGKLAPATQELLDRVESEIQRLNRVAQHYLQFSRPGKRQPQTVDLNALSEEVLDFMREELQRHQVHIHKQFTAPLPPVSLEPDQIRQALINLLRNAKEALATRGSGNVWVMTRYTDGQVRLSVEDDGPGMAPEEMARLFEPFYTTKSQGSGLGLALTRKIIHEQQGAITCQSRQEGGMIFELSFPAQELDKT